MAVAERDPHTGHMTTGHEWNGIKELNTPVPRAVYVFLAATVLVSVVCWLLLPAWPLGVTYTKGLLGIDQRTSVEASLRRAQAERAPWSERIAAASFQEIQADPALMQTVRETGRALFGDNCAVCHGVDGRGGPGFPNLTDTAWLWGGEPEAVAETVRVGINSGHDEARVAQMPAFGRDQMLERSDIAKVVTYVQSLSDPAVATATNAEDIGAGREIFAENCANCHGEEAKGGTAFGAPNLTDDFWIYGGDRQSIWTTVYYGRQGHMPHWEQRLGPTERKILTLYVLDLGAGQE
ncbi:MAG TPA: cytochrome-c oxidase, cbb3-type subunit III [Geminicoccaceae bacterium]|nr:cytochrome-c oxidase, cbb3-type subunit III [Geminicoccaceae bacterium]